MNGIYAAAFEVQRLFDQRGWRSCVIGGLAVIRWGRRRTTEDADFSLLTGVGDEDRFLSVVAAAFHEREPNEVDFALRNRVYRGYASNGSQVDIALAALPFEEQIIDRARPYEFMPGCVLRVCAIDDLIVMKAFAARPQDQADLENLAANHWSVLDWDRIEQRLEEICEMAENFSSVPLLHEIKSKLEPIMKRPRQKRS